MRALSLILALLFIAVSSGEGVSAPRKKTKQEIIKNEKTLEDVKKQITEEKKTVKAITEKETSVLEELEKINKNINAKREELKKAETSLARLQRDVNSTNANINRLERERKSLTVRLKQRLAAMYKMRTGEAVQVLFSSESPKDLGRRHKYLTLIMDTDSRLIEGYGENVKKLEGEKARLKSLGGELEAERKNALSRKKEAEALQKEKSVLLASVRQEKDRRVQVIGELEEAAKALSDLIKELRAKEEAAPIPSPDETGTGFGAMKGKLFMPVDGDVISSYGKVKHPKFQTITFNNGIMIEAPVGTPVKNIYDGNVIYVGWLKGYGQVMIIDHGGGYYTLFAHLSKVLTEKGEAVKRGDEVALVGDTGPQSTAGLYFEIRQKGVPRDPSAWFAEK